MGFPNVSDALWDWTTPITFTLLNTTIADYEVTESQRNLQTFDGTLEPINPRKLLVKPENQRRWKWWTLWTNFVMKAGDVCVDPQGFSYRVMSVQDWSGGNYLEYELVQQPAVDQPPQPEGT